MEKLPVNAVIVQTSGAEKAIGEGRRFMIVDELKDEGTNRRVKEVLKSYGPGARVVAPYQPNRKQRRAQKARKGRK